MLPAIRTRIVGTVIGASRMAMGGKDDRRCARDQGKEGGYDLREERQDDEDYDEGGNAAREKEGCDDATGGEESLRIYSITIRKAQTL
jgi:hypothetical protein